ncbi:uncharacterized protein LOC120496180 isoform X4 [Passer montanus]|uniref:uncharacterized protein LOC120496180 isoform X4 n=1 Tax=Passer montanus TaxID=9160 RepID=UPI0019609E1A|nr:uncharacterized protein LOC120496180 isoform X4 [Passer montanus]
MVGLPPKRPLTFRREAQSRDPPGPCSPCSGGGTPSRAVIHQHHANKIPPPQWGQNLAWEAGKSPRKPTRAAFPASACQEFSLGAEVPAGLPGTPALAPVIPSTSTALGRSAWIS